MSPVQEAKPLKNFGQVDIDGAAVGAAFIR